jgi:hypothetical protein
MRGHLQERGNDAGRLKVYVGRSAGGRKRYVEKSFQGGRATDQQAAVYLGGLLAERTTVAP